jgi:hypothetical protein
VCGQWETAGTVPPTSAHPRPAPPAPPRPSRPAPSACPSLSPHSKRGAAASATRASYLVAGTPPAASATHARPPSTRPSHACPSPSQGSHPRQRERAGPQPSRAPGDSGAVGPCAETERERERERERDAPPALTHGLTGSTRFPCPYAPRRRPSCRGCQPHVCDTNVLICTSCMRCIDTMRTWYTIHAYII